MDCEETYGKIEDLTGDSQAETLAMYSFVHRKNLYREGLFNCEGVADMDETPKQVREERSTETIGRKKLSGVLVDEAPLCGEQCFFRVGSHGAKPVRLFRSVHVPCYRGNIRR